MLKPNIDVTEAARAYGLRRVPPLVWDYDEIAAFELGDLDALFSGADAAFSPTDWTLHLGTHLLNEDWLTSDYNEGRFKKAGVSVVLGSDDALRFIIAHELWHAVQDEHSHECWKGSVYAPNHDKLPSEIDADQHAAKAYKLVKVNGH